MHGGDLQEIVRWCADRIQIVCASSRYDHMSFVGKVCKGAGLPVADAAHWMTPGRFSNFEAAPRWRRPAKEAFLAGRPMPVSGKSAYVFGLLSPGDDPEGLLGYVQKAASAAKDAGAAHVTAVLPYLPNLRQDFGGGDAPPGKEWTFAGQANSSKVDAGNFARNGVDRVVTMDAHSERVLEYYAEAYGTDDPQSVFVNIPIEGFLADYLVRDSLAATFHGFARGAGECVVLIAPDRGSWGRVERLAGELGLADASILYFNKFRGAPNDAKKVTVEFDHTSRNFTTLDGKIAVIFDDIIESGGTQERIYRGLESGVSSDGVAFGVPGKYVIGCTHPTMQGTASLLTQERLNERLGGKVVEYVFVSTQPHIDYVQNYRIKDRTTVLRPAYLFGDAVLSLEVSGVVRPELVVGNNLDVRSRYLDFPNAALRAEFFGGKVYRWRHSAHILNDSLNGSRVPHLDLRL